LYKNHAKPPKNGLRFFSSLNEFLHFEVALASEDGHRGCHDIHGALNNLKMQKFVQNLIAAIDCFINTK
jgi:hypothetical protein